MATDETKERAVRQQIAGILARAHEARGDLQMPAARRLIVDTVEGLLNNILALDLSRPLARDRLLLYAAEAQAAKKLYDRLRADEARGKSAEATLRKLDTPTTDGGNEQ